MRSFFHEGPQPEKTASVANVANILLTRSAARRVLVAAWSMMFGMATYARSQGGNILLRQKWFPFKPARTAILFLMKFDPYAVIYVFRS